MQCSELSLYCIVHFTIVMAHRNAGESTLSEKSASLRSSASRRTEDTDSTASVDSDGNEGGKLGDSREEFRVLGGETVLSLGGTSVGKQES